MGAKHDSQILIQQLGLCAGPRAEGGSPKPAPLLPAGRILHQDLQIQHLSHRGFPVKMLSKASSGCGEMGRRRPGLCPVLYGSSTVSPLSQ